MEFYLTDARDMGRGVVVLFGRQKGESARHVQVTVENICRVSYVRPRDEIEKVTVSMELTQRWPNILTSKQATRSYAFGRKDLAHGTNQYVKVKTSYADPNFPCGSGNTFSAAATPFQRNALQSFLIDRCIKGPSWLTVLDATKVNESDFVVTSPKKVFNEEASDSVLSLPPKLRIAELRIDVDNLAGTIKSVGFRLRVMEDGETVQCERRIVYTWTGYHPYTSGMEDDWIILSLVSEHAMLSACLREIQSCDVDMIYGYDITRLLEIVHKHSTETMHLGKLQGFWSSGILICDIKVLAKEIVNTSLRTFDLRTIGDAVLGPGQYDTMAIENVIDLLPRIREEMDLAWGIGAKTGVIELTRCLSKLAGCPWNVTLKSNRLQRIDYLLSHEFGGSRKFIVPEEKEEDIGLEKGETSSSSYVGGLVLDPIRGLHGKEGLIVLLDFRSLYPSLVCEHDICFVGFGTGGGVLPQILGKFMEMRRLERRKSPQTSLTLIRQIALKLIANTVYGCIGSPHCRYHSIAIASEITNRGRAALQDVVGIVRAKGMKVIFGDTDSIAIQTSTTDHESALSMAEPILEEVNAVTKFREMVVDKIFRALLVVSKKKYAYIEENSNKCDYKGIDAVRRDWSPLAKTASLKVVQFLLNSVVSQAEPKTVEESVQTLLQELVTSVRNGTHDIGDFVITKMLAQAPKDYKAQDLRALPHVRAAIKQKITAAKECVSYVVCKGKDELAPEASHNVLPMGQATLQDIDVDWYLSDQVAKCVARVFLLQPCNTTEDEEKDERGALCFVKKAMGLQVSESVPDATKEIIKEIRRGRSNPIWLSADEEMFSKCPPILLECCFCGHRMGTEERDLVGLLPKSTHVEIHCPRCKLTFSVEDVVPQLQDYLHAASYSAVNLALAKDYVRRKFDAEWTLAKFNISYVLTEDVATFLKKIKERVFS